MKTINISDELHSQLKGIATNKNTKLATLIQDVLQDFADGKFDNQQGKPCKESITSSNIAFYSSLIGIQEGVILDVNIEIGQKYSISTFNDNYVILLDSFGDEIMINYRKINDWFESGDLLVNDEIQEFEFDGPLNYETIKDYQILIAKKSGTFRGTKIVKDYEYPIIKFNTTYVFFQIPNYDENFIKYELINQWFTGK